MDVATQGLASLVVVRAFVPRASWRAWGVIVVAGTIANLDFVSMMFGPDAYLQWHRTYVHSIVVSLIVSAALAGAYCFATSDQEKTPAGIPALPKMVPSALFLAVNVAGLLHLALDACQSLGTMIFWPVSHQRVALDWLPRVDPWIIAILLVALLLPELARLVSDEIGARSKGGRGRIGAIVGLAVLALYVGLRADLHSNAIATLQNRSYDSGSPHRLAAYADPGSLFIWHGIVETERALHDPTVNIMASSQFDPDNGLTLFKPEPSPILVHAQQSDAARKLLAVAQFPKADIEKTADGYGVEIRDLRYAAIGDTRNEIRAWIVLDANGKVLNDELVWARASARR
ncbi:MAG: metal-dependent hydrolase [Acidobacteria bacterium]|nr:metal-dependent hydrolase [Acidobacteriota bacterium]